MKRIISYIFFLAAILMTACQQELIQLPETTKTASKFYSNEKELEEAVNAVYATLQLTGNYNISLPALGELPGEDAYDETPANDNGVYGQLDAFNVIPQSDLIDSLWKHGYKSIQAANIVLNRIDKITYASSDVKNARIGEMKFIRALLYFNLVRAFGDVPLVTEEITNPQNSFGQKRTPKAEVYKQIETDLTDAVALLPDRTEANKTRVVKTAAQALLGKVKLTLSKYGEAETFLLAVVNSKKHELLTDVNKVFATDNELNKEIIFAVQFASGLSSNSEGSDAYRMFNPAGRIVGNITGTKGHGVLKADFYASYSSTDLRKNVYVGSLPSGVAYNNKIAVPKTVVGDAASDWVVLRYADILLMLAEIENESGKTADALSYLNMIRNRAGIGDYTGTTDKATLFSEIDLQRRKELVWEGHRWFDLLRQGRAKTVLSITSDTQLLMPLPAGQIATDPSLEQNPGYAK